MKTKHFMAYLMLFSLLPFTKSLAQKAGDWSLGLAFQPAYFKLYNDLDWKNEYGNYPAKPNKFNGIAMGIMAEKTISSRFGIIGELTFSRQRQSYYTQVIGKEEPDGTSTYVSALSAHIRLDYLKLPLLATFNFEIGASSGLFLKLMAGPQISFCTDYHEKNNHYAYDIYAEAIRYDSLVWVTTISPFKFHHDFAAFDGTHHIVDTETGYLFRRLELSAVGGISLQKNIFGSYAITVGARIEQGLTGIENPDEDKFNVTLAGATGFYLNRPPTRTRRFVLSIGVSKTLE